MSKSVFVERDGHLTVITINRPKAYNALDANAHVQLSEIFDEFSSDESQWVAIITGAGDKAFCAGHDLKQQAIDKNIKLPPTGFGGITNRFNLSKPIIAAVNGIAMGGGFEIALACDIIVASASAIFALPEPKVGLAALAGGIQRLPRAIGYQRAMGMMLTGRRVTASEALALGFVNEVSDGILIDTARSWADDILACSPMSVRATKQAVTMGAANSIQDTMTTQWQYPAVKEMISSEDFVEGPKAFSEKRTPNWKGR